MSKRKGGTNSQIIPAKSNVGDLFKKSLTIDAAWDEKVTALYFHLYVYCGNFFIQRKL